MNLKIRPTSKQWIAWKYLFNRETSYILFGGGAGVGKSWLICEWLIYMCLKYPKTKWFIGREELKRLMGSTFVTFLKVASYHQIPRESWSLNGQYNYIEFDNGSRIDLLDVKHQPSDPLYERFGSMEFTGGALEETGEIHFLAYDVLKSRINRHMNEDYKIPAKLLCTCNPKRNWMYDEFITPFRSGKLDKDKACILGLYSDNPHTAKAYEQSLASIKDPQLRERLMLGNWEYDDDPSRLIESDKIQDMFMMSTQTEGRMYISADIARFGSDETVVFVWRGLSVIEFQTLAKSSMKECQNLIDQLAQKYRVPRSNIIIDADGIGGGVVDFLQGVKSFIANATPVVDKNFRNLKSECYYKLAEYIQDGKLAFTCSDATLKEKLCADLENVKAANIDKDEKRSIIPKEKVKEKLGRSPDYSDTLMMRMYYELRSYPTPTVGGARVFR
jgi:phage terminase large subunit